MFKEFVFECFVTRIVARFLKQNTIFLLNINKSEVLHTQHLLTTHAMRCSRDFMVGYDYIFLHSRY